MTTITSPPDIDMCCAEKLSQSLLLFLSCSSAVHPVLLHGYRYEVAGEIVLEEGRSYVLIKGFHYSGQGPAAFLFAGVEAGTVPSGRGIKLSYPAGSSAPLERCRNVTLTVSLPDGVKAEDLKWLSVWCTRYAVSYGDAHFHSDVATSCHSRVERPMYQRT